MRPEPADDRSAHLAEIHEALLDWYAANGRDLPWRKTRDPYHILVSEVMLQQTPVDRVLPKYRAFLECFPTLADLAAAPVGEVIRAWAPLGYNRRAIHLCRVAQQAVERYGGQLPSEPAALRALNGIGRYTAAAVACFAFRQQVPVVDTNVRRVLARVFLGTEPDRSPEQERAIWRLAEEALPPGRAYDWHQALMDLGATICPAARPACLVCPLQAHCAYAAGPRVLREPGPAWRASRKRPRPAFAGSNRYYRGRIVAELRRLPAGESLPLDELGRRLQPDFDPERRPWLRDLLAALQADGLVRIDPSGERVSLPW